MAEAQRIAARPPAATPARSPAARQPARLAPVQRAVLMRCACGGNAGHDAECDGCKAKSAARLQRQALDGTGSTAPATRRAPPIVHQVLHTAGRPLDRATRAYMEPRFGRDFSHVRLHTDAQAAASARAVQAAAYTVGSHIVFGAARHSSTPEGQKLLAHELAHVSQQAGSGAVPADLEVDHPTSGAEREAEVAAETVADAGAPATTNLSPAAPRVHRKLEGAVVGGAAGAVAGVALGALFGPIGMLVGGLVGLAAGALAGHLLTRGDKKDDEKGTPLARITKLLSTGILDWKITPEDAHAALGILQGLKPLEMLETVAMLKFANNWWKLVEHLSDEEREVASNIETQLAAPDSGYLTPQDIFLVEFDDGSDHQTTEKQMSTDYQVQKDGLQLPFLHEPVDVVGLLPVAAANAISQAYLDASIYANVTIRLTAKQRNAHYYPSQPLGAQPIASTITDAGSPEGIRRRKTQEFFEYVKVFTTSSNIRTQNAVQYFYGKVEKELDAYPAPEPLWKEAVAAANKPVPVSALQRFIDFGNEMQQRIPTATPADQKRMNVAYGRYVAWVSAHTEDPKLETTKPENIWAQAYVNAFRQETEERNAAYIKKVRSDEEKDHDAKALVKFNAALDLMLAKIVHMRRQEVILKHGTELNENNDLIEVGWIITPSDKESIIRQKIASEYMEDVNRRMLDPRFNDTTALEDLAAWLKAHPVENKALLLAIDHPDVERVETAYDVPLWQTTIEVGIGFIPIVGQVVGAYEVIAGEDLSGNPLSTTSRAILGAAILLPAAAKIFKVGRAAVTVTTLARDYRMTAPEANALFRATSGLTPGSKGALLLEDAAKSVKSGHPITDPKKLDELEGLFKELGLTDAKTADELAQRPESLLHGVDAQASGIVEDEVKALGNMDDASKTKLGSDPELRHALHDSPLAAAVLKKCASPCYPPELSADQVSFLEDTLRRFRGNGAYDEQKLKDFLYANRGDLNKALGDIAAAKDAGALRDIMSKDAMAKFQAGGGKIKPIAARESPAVRSAVVERAYDIGERYGRQFAVQTKGLTGTGFTNPFRNVGKYGQGFDDIMLHGTDIDKDLVYIVEYKGGSSVLSDGQMTREWVLKNIARLRNEGGAAGQSWAQKLTKALREGRLRGSVISTPITAGSPQATLEVGAEWVY